LVTGGCGFIGRNLVSALAQRSGDAVRVVDDLSVGTFEELAAAAPWVERIRLLQDWGPPGSVQLVVGDVRGAALIAAANAGADAMVHLAANSGVGPSIEDPLRDCTINVIGTLNCLEACRAKNVRRFVLASSGASIGESEPPLHEELPAHPVSPYGASKLAGEAYCSAYKSSFEIDTVALRFGNCYGPYSSHKSSLIAKLTREALAGEDWHIYGDGRQTRDFIYVSDIVDAIIRAALAANVGGEVFQIATNTETTVLEVVEKLARLLERHGVRLPRLRHAERRTGDVKRNYSDTRKARQRLGWSAQVSLDDGLERVVEWFLKRRRQVATGGRQALE
jgi:UDP-glucose 4-epimerase